MKTIIQWPVLVMCVMVAAIGAQETDFSRGAIKERMKARYAQLKQLKASGTVRVVRM